MSNSKEIGGGGIGFLGALALLFIGLKLGHVIDWSWVWVISPLWLPLFAVVIVFLVAGWAAAFFLN